MTTSASELVAVLGANGVYARHLIPRLVTAGHRVRALVRRPEAAGVARACGAEVHVADIFDPASLSAGLAGCTVGINLATSLPGPSGRGDYDVNDRVRRDGTVHWVAACKGAGVERVIQQSIAMVNATEGDAWASEETPLGAVTDPVAARAIEAALAMERVVQGSGLDAWILRGGLFYGPGTGFDDDWFARARAGKLRLPGDGDGFVSLVHIADMASATVAVLSSHPRERTLIVADDGPCRWKALFDFIAVSAGGPPPSRGGRLGFPSFRVTNRLAREALRWAPTYADYRAGMAR